MVGSNRVIFAQMGMDSKRDAPGRRAWCKFATVVLLCLASVTLFSVPGRYVTARTGIVENLDFARGGRGWAGTPGVSLRAGAGGARILVLANEARPQAIIARTLPGPARFANIRIAADIRVRGVVPGPAWWNQAGFVLLSFDARGAKMKYWPWEVALLSGDRDWRRYEAVIPVAEAARRMALYLFLGGNSGTMAVRDIAVDAVNEATWFAVAEPALIALWIAVGLWILLPLVLRKRRSLAAGLALLALVGVFAGVLTPQPQLSDFTANARAAVQRLTAAFRPGAEVAEEAAKDKSAAAHQKDKKAPPQKKPAADEKEAPPPGVAGGFQPGALTAGDTSFIAHFAAHAILAFLVCLAFRKADWRLLLPGLLLVAVSDEVLQVFVVTRTADPLDGALNAAGIVAGVTGYRLWRVLAPRLGLTGRDKTAAA